MEINRLIGLQRQARKDGWKKDWTPADEDALLRGCWFDEEAAHDPIEFIENFCKQSQGERAGQPLLLFDWQKEDFIFPLFGWKREDGSRRYRRTYLSVAKKNGKSTLSSGLGLYSLLGDGEPGAQVYSVATSREQAKIVHDEAANMVKASPALNSLLSVVDHRSRIMLGHTAWMAALSAEPKTSEGIKTSCLIIDELHKWVSRKLFASLRWSMRTRRQPLTIMITTRGEDENSICGEIDIRARKILTGEIIEFDFLPLIYAPNANPDIDPLDSPATWKKANPSLDLTPEFTTARFADDYNAAKNGPPADMADFKRYCVNLWSGAANPFFHAEKWAKLEQKEIELRGLPCWAGIDISAKEDISSFVICFQLPDGRPYFISRHWCPSTKVKDESDAGRPNYENWQLSGDLLVIPGKMIDQRFIENEILDLYKIFKFKALAFDRYLVDQLMLRFNEKKIKIVEFHQGFEGMNMPTNHLKALIQADNVAHDGNKVMNWMVGNVVIQTSPNQYVRPVKRFDGKEYKIDGPMAAIMSLGLMLRLEDKPKSRYEDPAADLIVAK